MLLFRVKKTYEITLLRVMTVKVVLKTTKFGSFSLGHSGPCDRETYEAVE